MEKKENQRTRLTKQLLRKSLVSLLQKKPLYQITVSELCSEAQINRSTFYKHYGNVVDVMTELENEVRQKIKSCTQETKTEGIDYALQPLYNLLCYMKENQDTICLILKHSYDDSFLKTLVKDVLVFMTDVINNPQIKEVALSDYIFKFIIAGNINIIENWITGSMNEMPMEIAQIICDISIAILQMERSTQK